MDEAVKWRQNVQLIPSPRKVLAQELDMFKGQMSIIDRNSDLIRRNDRTSCIMTRQNKNYKHMFGSPSGISSKMRMVPSQEQVVYTNKLDQMREQKSNGFAQTGRFEHSMFAPPTQESTRQNNKLSLRTNNYRDKNSEPYRFSSTRNSLQFDRTQDGISRSSFSQYNSTAMTPSKVSRSMQRSPIETKRNYKVDYSLGRNIVNQMTNKIAETPIQQRKLANMGFKGSSLKMQQYVNNQSQLIINSSMSPSRFDSSQMSKHSEIDRSGRLEISVSEITAIRAPSPTIQKHSKFMTQKEKDSLWIQEQRNFMIAEADYLEQENRKILDEITPQQGQSLQAMNVVMDRDKLPPLQELESKGETLQKRIKNYNQNLSAIETPILDQIQGQVQKIKFDLDVFNRSNSNEGVKPRQNPVQKKSSMSVSSAKNSQFNRKLLTKQSIGSGLSQFHDSSVVQETDCSRLNLMMKQDSSQQDTKLSPRSTLSMLQGDGKLLKDHYSDNLMKSKMAIFLKGKMVDHNIRALSPIKALSKKEIMERLEQHQARQLEKAMMRGTKMYGKTGGVSIEKAEYKQRENLKWQEDVIHDRQMDLLVYNIKDEAKKQHKYKEFMLNDQFDNIMEIKESIRMDEILKNAAQTREANAAALEMMKSKESFNTQFTNTQHSKFDIKMSPIPEVDLEDKKLLLDKISMLKSLKKSDSDKKKDFMRKHKKLLSYIDRLNESILKPVTNTYKKQQCLYPKDDPDNKKLENPLQFRRQNQISFNEQVLKQQASLTSCLQTDDSIVEEEIGLRNDESTFLRIFDLKSNTQSETNFTADNGMQSKINLIQSNNHLRGSPQTKISSPMLNLKFCDSTQQLHEVNDTGLSEIQSPPPLQLGLDLQDSVAEQYLNEKNALLILNHSREKQTGKVIGQIKDEFVDQLKLITQKRKYVTSLSKRAKMDKDPVFVYFEKCMKEFQLDMPVFEKMRESSLIVRKQVLTAGHCLAIKEGCKIMNTKELAFHHVLFESNSLGDTEFKIIVEALNQVKMLKRIEIKNNVFGLKSMQAFQPLFYRNTPYQLRELRLIDCKMIPAVTFRMFDILSKHCSLESLLVQKAHYNQDAVNRLCDIIKSSRSITSLDIAGSDFNQPQKQYCQLMDAISLNRRLVNLNLEWNNLGSAPSIKIVLDKERQAEIQQQEITDPKEKKKHDPSIVDMKMHIALCLVKIIKYSKKLQHLNLENTGLTLEMANVVIAGLRKSMSLQSLHLSNNPFLRSNQNVISEIREKIRAKDLMKRYVFMSDDTIKGICQPHNQQELIHLQRVNAKNNILKTSQNNHVVDAFWNNQLILQRKLNHKHDIKGIGQWDIISDRDKHEKVMKEVDTHKACWICSNQIYSLIFWSESIQNFILKEQHKINTMYLNSFVYNISQGAEQTSNPELKQHFQMNNENFDDFIKIQQKSDVQVEQEKLAHKLAEQEKQAANSKFTSGVNSPVDVQPIIEIKKPVIYSNAMDDWHPQTMFTLEEFTKMNWVDDQGNRGYTEPDILKILADRKQLSKNLVHPSMLNKKERRIYDEECKLQKDEFRRESMNTLLKSLKYQYPQLVNADLAMESIHSTDEPLFVIPVFMQPGKHCMMVSFENNGTVDRTLQTFIVNPRQEKIPDFFKVLGVKKKVEVAFSKKTSVFAAWMPDSSRTIKESLEENDFLHWRAENFIKEEDELAEVRKFLTKNFDITKEIFINLQGESTQYPGLTKLVLNDFCKQLGLMQTFPHFKQDTSGRQFIAATFQNLTKEQQEHKKVTVNKIKAESGENGIIPSEDVMIRFQFIEFILRIVKVLYIDTGTFHKYVDGLVEFYSDPLLKYRNTFVKNWQNFRDKTLWQPQVHDLLHANEDHLKSLYKANCIKPRKHWNFSDSMRFMMSGGIMNLQTKRRKAIKVGTQEADRAQIVNAMSQKALKTNNTDETSEQSSSEEDDKPGRPPSFLNMTERQARLCYALSKQTVTQNEGLEGIFKYDKLPYVEFLELLGRIAAVRFVGTEFENEPFIKRLEYIVDSSLQVIGAVKNEATNEEADQSESDNEY